MARKEYAGGAAETTLSSSITNVSTSITVQDATNWPTGAIGAFWIKIGVGLSNEEKIKCISRSGNVLTVASGGRGGDGTTAIAHDPPEIVRHEFVREDAEEANQHINETTHDHHTQYFNAARHASTAQHVLGTAIAVSASAADLSGTASAGGAAANLSRGDHAHAFPAWTAYTPTFTGFTLGNGTVTARALRVGKMGFLSVKIVLGSSSAMTGFISVGLPAGWTVQGTHTLPTINSDGSSIIQVGVVSVSGTAAGFFYSADPSNAASADIIAPGVPFAWGTNASITFSGLVELQ